jgi:acyl carrier protein
VAGIVEPSARRTGADLGVDSLEMLEVALVPGVLGGHEVPHEVLATTRTLGDLYEVACRYAFHR